MKQRSPHTPPGRSAAAAALALLLLLSAAPLVYARREAGFTLQQQPSQDAARASAVPLLQQGETVEAEFKGGAALAFTLTPAAGHYAQVVFLWKGVDFEVSVYDPDGRRLGDAAVQVRAPGPVSVSFIADAAREYRFEARPSQKLKIDGAYAAQLRAVRQPTRADENRVRAERALAEAMIPGAAAPEVKLKEALQLWRDAEDPEGEAAGLQALAELHRGRGAFPEAWKTFEEARAVRQRMKDPTGEAHVLLYMGGVFQEFSSPEEALTYYRQALALFRGAGNRTGESMTLYSAGLALARAGRVREAVKSYEEALNLQSADGDRLREVRTLNALGGAYDRLGEYDTALALYQRAAPLRQQLGDRLGEALTINNIGVLHDNWGDWQKARESYEAARDAYGALLEGGLTACAAGAPTSSGRVCDYAAAALENLGELYNTLGDPEEALTTFEKALVIWDKLNRPKGQGSTRARMCYSNVLLGRPREALTLCRGEGGRKGALSFQEPADRAKPSVDPPGLAVTYLLTGMAYDALAEREQALDYFGRASEILRKIDDPRSLAITLDKAGAAYERAGDTKQAFESFGEALRLWQRIKDRDGEAITLYKIARAERGRGNLVEAHARVMSALDIVESLRVKVTAQRLRASYFAQKLDYYELAVDVKMQLAKAGGLGVAAPAELVAAALRTSEQARARVLLDILAEARVEPRAGSDPALDELLRRRQELQRRLNHNAALLLRPPAANTPAGQSAAVEREVSRLAAEYDDVDALARARIPRYAELTRPQPLGVAEIQRDLLDEQTLLLEYALGEERSYLWLVARSGVKSFELPKRAKIEEAARRVGDILRDGQRRPGEPAQSYQTRLAGLEGRFREEAAPLSEMVLGPAAADLGGRRLLIVAPGELQRLPFAALPSPAPAAAAGGRARVSKPSSLTAAGDPAPLGEAHEIIYLPSASALAAIRVETRGRRPAPRAVAILADPIFDRDDPRLQKALKAQPGSPESPGPPPQAWGDALRSFGAETLPRLFSSRREANDIVAAAPAGMATAALDFEANKSTATGPLLGRHRIIHFATHGVYNDRQPELSGVVLSLYDERGRSREDGFLRLHDVYNLNLPADMVVLSACQTGLGKQVRGEGMIGLTRGFMYAGAARVVASLWKVDDEATAELMRLFYGHMLRDGMSPPAALKEAQMSVRRQRRWSAPYHWAGFVLHGEWK